MKMLLTYLILFIIVAAGCSNGSNVDTNLKTINNKFVKAKLDTPNSYSEIKQEKERLNYTDTNNLKQGKWIETGYKDKVISIKHYKDNILNGYFFELKGMQRDGYFINGKRNGFFRTYYDNIEDEKVMLLTLYKNDSILWHVHPAADEDYLIPIKGIRVFKDSIYVSAPYTNGKIWYEGLFIKSKYKGIHKIHSKNGNLKATVDHDNKIISFFGSIDNKSIGRLSNDWEIETNGNTEVVK